VTGGHPYRTAAAPRADEPSPPPLEEIVAYALALLVGSIPAAGAIADGGSWGAAATVGLIVAVLGLGGLARTAIVFRRARNARRAPPP
jgi:hypothetical protein